MTVTGKTVGENKELSKLKSRGDPPGRKSLQPLRRNASRHPKTRILAPDSAVVKRSLRQMLRSKVRQSLWNAIAESHQEEKDRCRDVVVIRYEGPKGGPGMITTMLNPPPVQELYGRRFLITDGRFSGASSMPIGHALVEEGRWISIDIDNHSLNVLVSDESWKQKGKTEPENRR